MNNALVWQYKLGDLGRHIEAPIIDDETQASLPLDNLTFYLKARTLDENGEFVTVFENEADVDTSTSIVDYDPQNGWFDTPGLYYVDFKAYQGATRLFSFPDGDEYIMIEVVPD